MPPPASSAQSAQTDRGEGRYIPRRQPVRDKARRPATRKGHAFMLFLRCGVAGIPLAAHIFGGKRSTRSETTTAKRRRLRRPGCRRFAMPETKTALRFLVLADHLRPDRRFHHWARRNPCSTAQMYTGSNPRPQEGGRRVIVRRAPGWRYRLTSHHRCQPVAARRFSACARASMSMAVARISSAMVSFTSQR